MKKGISYDQRYMWVLPSKNIRSKNRKINLRIFAWKQNN